MFAITATVRTTISSVVSLHLFYFLKNRSSFCVLLFRSFVYVYDIDVLILTPMAFEYR